MIKRENKISVCVENDVTLRNCSSDQSTGHLKLECALGWSDRCFHCEYQYDELKMNGSLSKIQNAINSCDTKIKEMANEFSTNMDKKLALVEKDMISKLESIKNELEISSESEFDELKRIEKHICELISNDIDQIKQKQIFDDMNTEISILIESINFNLNYIQQLFDFKIKLECKNKINSNDGKYEMLVNSSLKLINEGNSLLNFLDKENFIPLLSNNYDKNFIIRDIFYINDELIGFYFINNEEFTFLIDRNTLKVVKKEQGAIQFVGISDGFVLKFDENNRITIMNSKLEIKFVKEKFLLSQRVHVEALNDCLIATSDWFNITIISVREENINIVAENLKAHVVCVENSFKNSPIKALKRLSNEKFASYSKEAIKIWDFAGNLVLMIENELKEQKFKFVDVLAENLLVCSVKSDEYSIKIWNFSTGDLVKEFQESELIGVMSFGFLVRKKEYGFRLDCYSKAGDCLGSCSTEGTYEKRIEHIKYLQGNLYAFFLNGRHEFKLIKLKDNQSGHNCALLRDKRCAFCELGFLGDITDSEILRFYFKKSLKILEEAQSQAFLILNDECSKAKQEINEKLELQYLKLENVRKENFNNIVACAKDILKCYRPPLTLLRDNSQKIKELSLRLHQVQKYHEINYNLEFDADSFRKNPENKILKFKLKQIAWDLPTKYFNSNDFCLLHTIKKSSEKQILDFAMVSNDKIAILFDKSITIHNISDGTNQNFIFQTIVDRMLFIKDKFVLLNKKDSNDKLFVISLDKEKKIYRDYEIEEPVTKCAILNDDILLLAGESITFWDARVWPFFQISKLEKPHLDAVNCLIVLPNNLFASSSISEVKIWNNGKKLLKQFDVKEIIYELKYLGDSKMLFRCKEKAYIYYLKASNTLSNINLNGHVLCSALTPDNQFLLFVKYSSLMFYHIKGCYFYCEYDCMHLDNFLNILKSVFKVTDSLVFGVAKKGVYEFYGFKAINIEHKNNALFKTKS